MRSSSVLCVLWLAGCSQEGPGDAGTDGGPDGGLVLDLRFRGVGSGVTLTNSLAFVGGTSLGVSEGSETNFGTSLGISLNESDFFILQIIGNKDLATSATTIYTNGSSCPNTFAAVMNGHELVMGLGGDPSTTNSTCTITTATYPDAGPQYSYLYSVGVTPEQILTRLAQDEASRASVITAIANVDGGYAFVAEALSTSVAATEQFETVIQIVGVDAIEATAVDLADAGYVITASAFTGVFGDPFALVGTRRVGAMSRYTAAFRLTDLGTYDVALAEMLSEGFAPVSFTNGHLPDGGLPVYLVGEK